MNPIIETHGLFRRFGPVEALNGLDLAVPEGSIFAFLGPNGAGKTTTIKVLMNMLRPDRGTSHVLGVESRKLKPEHLRQIGYVSENQELHEYMTVRELIDYCRPFYPAWDTGFERQLLGDFLLPQDRKVKHLSRGMKAKLSLLISIAYRPRLLILDEPFSGLDPLARDEFLRGVLELTQQERWTIFISSHDIEEVERLADWIGILNRGELLFAKPVDEIRRRFRRIELTTNGDAPLPAGPREWLGMEKNGNVIRFTASDYDESATPATIRSLFSNVIRTDVHSLTLRDVYLALAKSRRISA